MSISRVRVTDKKGRVWTISKVPKALAAREDFRFWYEQLTPEERVDLVDECLESSLKARGRGKPRLRRVHRRVKRKRR